MSEDLKHYGVKRRSGRYPWGSGEDPQRSKDLLGKIDDLKAKGLSEKEIVSELGMTSTSELRSSISWANNTRKAILQDSIVSRSERGLSNTAIAKELGVSEASVRNYLKNKDIVQDKQLNNITDVLKDNVGKTEYLDVGVGVERQMGISRSKLKAAVSKLKEEGYYEHDIYVKRLTDPSKYTTVRVLTKEPNLELVKKNSDKIRPVESWTDDGGRTFQNLKPVEHLDWDRVDILYGDKGGSAKDGVIELRRGVKDLDLGDSKYAQVRIAVGKDKYLKGMAMYSDDIPAGKDILFNTNKKSNTPKEKVLKEMKKRSDGKINDDNPFGATINRQKGALNIVNEEGDWGAWKSSLSSQFLSKQPKALVKDRLDATFNKVKTDFDDIMKLNNPVVKKHLLDAYANELDSKSKHLKAQGLPRTKGHVILPFPGMRSNEVYAPNYKDGERVVLVRYPHGGIFEIPELTVNNRGPAKKSIGNAIDAIGIHPSVASKLSGADFDGDTVYVIPNNKKQIKVSRSLKELKDFDPNSYQVDHATITPRRKQTLMGVVSNLITDMTIKGASQGELARAVKHSMVVIDSEKHNLDHKRSAAENGIGALQKKYQTHISPVTGKKSVGASTLISTSKRDVTVGGTKETYVDPKTGKKKTRLIGGKKVALVDMVDDVRKLTSGTAIENEYATYVNKVKSMSNKAKKTAMSIPGIKKNKQAAVTYKKEVDSLDAKLNKALLNAPRERQAQLLASNTYYKNLTYDMSPDQKKKLKAQAIAAARTKVGAQRSEVVVTSAEWKAIQSGAVSNNRLTQILQNADMDKIKQLATPKPKLKMNSAKTQRVKNLLDKGYTFAEVANDLGVSVSTIRDAINGE
ncbi:MAG: helix-turn-helix domain-containing protein [Anaerorhabdus sp.]|uniref:helix-turn-helix domain-containing protein n=1 Tax=Anaerorhabdus sp. TaxID=1872524 RepID=UPI002FCA3E3B